MKKMLLPLLGIMFAAGLSHDYYSTLTAAAAMCLSIARPATHTCNSFTDINVAKDSQQTEAITGTTSDAAEQIEGREISFSDRMLHFLDSFAKLVMVI